jgi:hypothetical protein
MKQSTATKEQIEKWLAELQASPTITRHIEGQMSALFHTLDPALSSDEANQKAKDLKEKIAQARQRAIFSCLFLIVAGTMAACAALYMLD